MVKSQMPMGEPIKQSSTFLVSLTKSFNSAKNWLKYLLHGDGKSMWSNFEFGENPFLGKINFDFWSKKAPKNACPFAHTPTFFICSRRESLGAVFDLHYLGCCMFSSRIWALDDFSVIKNPQWALSLKRMEVSWVWNPRFWICYVFLPHVDSRSSFSGAWEFRLVMFLWLGFFPNVFCCIPHCLSRWKSFLCCPAILRRDHILLGVVDEFVFGHVRAKMSLGCALLLVGCSYAPWQSILWLNYFPQPRNGVYCYVCNWSLDCVGVERSLLNKPIVLQEPHR